MKKDNTLQTENGGIQFRVLKDNERWAAERMRWLKREGDRLLSVHEVVGVPFCFPFGLCGLGRQKLTSAHPGGG